jgi:hypothetical protein
MAARQAGLRKLLLSYFSAGSVYAHPQRLGDSARPEFKALAPAERIGTTA